MPLRIRIIMFVLVGVLLAACNFSPQDSTPTSEGIIEEPINPIPDQPETTNTPAFTATPSPSPSPEQAVQVATSTPAPTLGSPTETPTPTETLGPWEYTVQAGDSLYGILQQPPYNYAPFDQPDIVSLVVRLNNLSSPDSLFEGQTILIPRPTPTPIPQGLEITQTVSAETGGSFTPRLGPNALPTNTVFDCHTVESGETIVGIVERFSGATLELLCQLNVESISCSGCDFNSPSGGENCAPLISPGQCIIVPYPTATPTLSPTPSGNETATPTPTYRAPDLVYPPQGGIAPPGIVTLIWVSVGVLEDNEAYLVEISDITTGAPTTTYVTRNTTFRLPASLIPTDGQTHNIQWAVQVGTVVDVVDGQTVYAPVGAGITRSFQWQSR